MCGRYGFSLEDEEVRRILRAVRALEGAETAGALSSGEIFPGSQVPILVAGNGQVLPVSGRWGLAKPGGKGLVINARTETALQKPMFRGSSRCIVPTTGFYEWKHEGSHDRFLFHRPCGMTYLAGLYRREEGERRFVILTTGANRSMAPVHHRMPLVLSEEQGLSWLYDRSRVAEILALRPDELSVDPA